MRKLLSANFSRLWKDTFFWGLLAFMTIGSVIFSFLSTGTAMDGEETYYVEDMLFSLLPMIGFVCAFFISLRVGAEYDNHTIRNKLIVGHTRTQVFFSEYLTCMCASVILLLAMLLSLGIFGYGMFHTFMSDGKLLLQMIFCSILLTAVFSAMCLGISMNIQNRAIAVVVNIVFVFVILYITAFVGGALNEEEMTYEYVRMSVENGIEFGDMVKNPAYVDGVQRKIYEFLYDALPTGQASQLNNLEYDRISRWPLLSAIMLAVSTFVGFIPFSKRDIR